jgi:hypothetical protein
MTKLLRKIEHVIELLDRMGIVDGPTLFWQRVRHGAGGHRRQAPRSTRRADWIKIKIKNPHASAMTRLIEE